MQLTQINQNAGDVITTVSPAQKSEPRPRLKILIRFPHGLGDAVQLTIVLRHIQKHRPDWDVDVLSGWGKHTLFYGLCANSWYEGEVEPNDEDYYAAFDLGWFENYNAYADCQSTKVTNCLREVFAIGLDPSLMNYVVKYAPDVRQRALSYLVRSGVELGTSRFKAVVAHYKGNTSPEKKNLSDNDLFATAELCRQHGRRLLVLDFDSRVSNPIRDHEAVLYCSHETAPDLWMGAGTGDGATMAALVDLCEGAVGIDSGPGHVFGATSTPTVIVWVRHHPVMFYDLCANVTHLLPQEHRSIPPSHHDHVWNYFRDHYTFRTYRDVGMEIAAHVAAILRVEPLKQNPMTRSHMLKATNFHREYYEEHKAAGLDYLGHGEWQDSYGKWIVDVFNLRNKDVLDIGCACGSIALGIQKAGARAHGVDLNNHMIRLGQDRFRLPLYVCDSINLHLFGANSFAMVHSNQVGEHWKKELVPFILKEQLRVLSPGGYNLCVMDTKDLFERQQRIGEEEDPTNGCIESLEWWKEEFTKAGYVPADPAVVEAFKNHPMSFLKRYDWDWCLFRKPEAV